MDLYQYLIGDFPSKEERERFLKSLYGPLYLALAINLEIRKAVNKIEDRLQKSMEKFIAKNLDSIIKII